MDWLVRTSELPWEPAPVEGVSWQLLQEVPQGTIKRFRLQPGASYPVHHHPDRSEWVYTVVGTLTVTLGSTVQELQPGDFAWIPVGLAHGLGNQTDEVVEFLVGAFSQVVS
ncbi:MAG: cupin domain-containing protein [Firmicutes bacterium]|nr:cupin domain-containing protein [Bacillota bacterium]